MMSHMISSENVTNGSWLFRSFSESAWLPGHFGVEKSYQAAAQRAVSAKWCLTANQTQVSWQ